MATDPSPSESPPPSSPNGPGAEPLRIPDDPPAEGMTAEVALQFAGLVFTGPGEGPLGIDLTAAPRAGESRTREARSSLSWSTVVLGSYASAVTMALIWVLATGKTLPKFRDRPQSPGRAVVEPREARPPASPRAEPPAPPGRSVALGKTLVVGDLEVMPLMVLHKTVRITKGAGLDGPGWETPDCLVLTLRLKNASRDRAVTPLEPPGAHESRIDMGASRRISMFELDQAGDWVIDGQSFPTIAPGTSADVVVVSESVHIDRLIGPLTWWVALKTGGEETETVGVRFTRNQVAQVGG